MKQVIVFGNDHTNSIGVIQSLGIAGYRAIGLLYGHKTGFVRNSIFVDRIISAKDAQSCIDKLLIEHQPAESKTPIIACCDLAALTLEKNKDKLQEHYIFEHASNYTLDYLAKKENQVRLAIEAGFNVPKSWNLNDTKHIPDDVIYPCLIKPLVSCEGAKSDIRVCCNREQLEANLKNLKTKNVLLQQYIDRDYEISILGCGLSNGDCLIPAVENKLTLYPKYVGLECLANMEPLADGNLKSSIKKLVQEAGYVGLFSVEMMHCKIDGKFYFTEINLRNDGAESFVTKYGANLPLNHVEDLLGKPLSIQKEFHPGYYIWDMHHFRSLMCGDISIITWIKEIKKSNGFLMYCKQDKKPFYRQYSYILGRLLRIIKVTDYE